jgi:hypothetical protein
MSKRGMMKNTPEDIEQKWVGLFAGLAAARVIERPTESDLANVVSLLAGVRLIQPFDWMKWQVMAPSLDEIPSLSLADCVRHITALVRSERYREADVVDGSVWYSLCEGRIESICETARIATNAGIVPPLEELGD